MTGEAIKARFQLSYDDFSFDVDLTLPDSGVTVLLGPSGSGKTTLLRCMAGLERAPIGYFSINGLVWQDSVNALFLPTHRRNLGYVFQEANLFPHLNIADNLQFGLKRLVKADHTYTRLPQVIELLGIGQLLKRMPDRLSGGERQRVAIARALVLNPAILLMDEPLAALDDKRKQEVMPYLYTLQREFKMPVVYVTHSLKEAGQLSDFLVLLDNGRMQAFGTLSEVLGRTDLPLAKAKQASVVWEIKIIAHEPEFKLTDVSFSDGTLSLPMIDSPINTLRRIQIYARDVSITLQQAQHTSILNVLPAIITAINDDEQDDQVVVQLKVGAQQLLSHVTRKSMQSLSLTPGLAVFVQIKGTSLLP